MPIYSYKALDANGEHVTGVLDGERPQHVRQALLLRNLHALEIKPVSRAGGLGDRLGLEGYFRRRNAYHVALAIRQLAGLLAAGVPVADALESIIRQTDSKRFEAVLRDVREKVSHGLPLSGAMRDHPGWFSPVAVSVIAAGEAGGEMPKVMRRLAQYLVRRNQLESKIGSALTYPVFMAAIAACVVAFLVKYVIPKLAQVLLQSGQELPLITRGLLGFSSFVGSYWWLIGIVAAMLFAAWRSYLGTPRGRLWWDGTQLRLPILGPLLRKRLIARFSLTLSTLLESGIQLTNALESARGVVGNAAMAKAVESLRTEVTQGKGVARSMQEMPIFPPVMVQMIATAEDSGELPTVLSELADAYDMEVDTAVQRVTSVMEPLVTVFMGAVVLLIVLSVLLPIMRISHMPKM